MSTAFCGLKQGEKIDPHFLTINSCYRETVLDGLFPILFFITSCVIFSISRYQRQYTVIDDNDCLRLPTSKTVSVFKRSLVLLVVTLLEISSWAFLFAWRLESAILERSKDSTHIPPLYQVIDPGLAFIPRIYILILVIKSFTTPANPIDPSKFTRYSHHFLTFYSITFISAMIRFFDYYFTVDNNWFISSAIEKSFACIDLALCFILWIVIITSPSELDQGELVDFDDDDDGVLVLHDGRVGRILSLESCASPLSSITFSWMNPLLKLAFKSRLTSASLWALPTRQRARENYRLFTETSTSIISMKTMIQRIYQSNRKIVVCQFMTAIAAVLFHYANPFFLRKLLNYIQEHHHQQGHESSEVGYLYCVALFACNVVSTLVASQTLLWGRRWHVTITHMLNAEIYAHALRLKVVNHTKKNRSQQDDEEEEEEEGEDEEEEEDEDQDESIQQRASLMSQDTERLAELASYLHIFYTCPLEIAAGVIFLYQILGNSFLAGLIVMVVALPSTHYISRRLMMAQTHLADAKSWRLRLLRELCEGIKTIKFLASERRWEQAITNARDDELVKLIKLYTQNTILGLIWFATPVFVTTISFAWYTMVEKKTLDASTAFVSIVLFGMLRDPLNVMPQAFMAYSDAKISLGHITTFLNTPEREHKQQQTYEEQIKVGFGTNCIFEWPQQQQQTNFKLVVPPTLFPVSKLSIISGSQCTGKTSVLAALLGDMEGNGQVWLPSRYSTMDKMRDRSLLLHKVAYVAQQPWIEHGTIRENILFSEPWDDTRYRAVLHQCDLLRDLSLFDNGDLTCTSDRGISGSEIMQHKISLARAVYSRAKTVLIDDIFHALGKLSSTFIYENCIRGDLMKERTIIAVVTWPDMFWARDARLFINMTLQDNNHATIEDCETNPEKIVNLIKMRRRSNQKPDIEEEPEQPDVIDSLFDNQETHSTHNNTLFDEDFFDTDSIIPDSIRQEQDQSRGLVYKSRDYAYATYYAACGGWKYWTSAILFTLLARLANISEGYWLKEEQQPVEPTSVSNHYVMIYLGLCLVTVACNFIRTVIQYRGSLRASNRMFLGLLQSVCHAPLQFFDITPVSQIMSRFSKDMETVDSSIGWHVNFLLQTVFGVFGVVFTIGMILPEFFAASLVAALLYLYIGLIYIRASRELKRLNAESRPPIFHLYTDTLAGLATIRAYGEEWTMMKKMFVRLDDNMRPFYTLWTTNRWLFVRVELLGTFLSLFISVTLIQKIKTVDAGLAGIALTFSTSLLEYVYWLMRQSTTVDMHFEAVERINEYMDMPQEPPSIVEGSRPPAAWPTTAAIQVRDLMVSFTNSETDAILKHISFNIFSGEKVALVGRAGAEKIALISCLFRFMEPMRGSIKIDGVNIAWIGVEDLRSRITFISKDGWLLSGTVRSNLDPFGEYDDYALWQVLYRVRLARPSIHDVTATSSAYIAGSSAIQDLDKDLGKEGRRLPVYERQLLCIARALLQDCTKLVIIEEAQLSPESQEIIQSVIDQEFEESTLIVIPYMLHDVVNYDKVMVFDEGNLVEYDSAVELLNKQHSLLQSLCEKAGILDELTLDTDILVG
ncbi:hypothetical protein MFLAVUS_009880 [Mucor flavus]|uniref:Uncharacterized protein n=1 Tax=Mucor flavus TaxID=439312 RepID=A0ABP9ZB40_9FUNG